MERQEPQYLHGIIQAAPKATGMPRRASDFEEWVNVQNREWKHNEARARAAIESFKADVLARRQRGQAHRVIEIAA